MNTSGSTQVEHIRSTPIWAPLYFTVVRNLRLNHASWIEDGYLSLLVFTAFFCLGQMFQVQRKSKTIGGGGGAS